MHRLSALDAQFLAAESGNSGSQYCGVAIYQTGKKRPITAATMRLRLAGRIRQCPPLRWKLVEVPLRLDRPVFVESEVDLSDHVCETTLTAPADERTLAAEVANILAARLDRDKPLWKLQVIHGLPGRTAVVMTLHHAAVDGIAASEIFAAILDGPADTSPASGDDVDAVPGKTALAARGIASIPARPLRALRSAPGALAHLDQVPVLRSLPGVHTLSQLVRGDLSAERLDAPRTRFNAKLSPARSVAFGTVPLSDVKAIKNALGITVNDVVIALCAGALRRRLTSTDELPATPLVAYIPVSTRLPDAKDRYGNAITSIIAPIPTHLAVCARATRVRTRHVQARKAAFARGAAHAVERCQRANPVADVRNRRSRPDGAGLFALRAPTGEPDHLERAGVPRQVDVPRRTTAGPLPDESGVSRLHTQHHGRQLRPRTRHRDRR